MQFGNAYKITILAKQNSSAIKASVAAVNLLPQQDAQQVMGIVKQINNLGIPKDEAAFLDLDRVYMAKNLLNETIETLKSQVKAGSQNPALYRVLGDRYLEAGLPEEAKREYIRATTLAKRVDNSAELAKAQAGLQRVALYSQLPTKINGDQ
jgi:tetratricopeptide (TPR) repeat protein